jgi:hypothetical protein
LSFLLYSFILFVPLFSEIITFMLFASIGFVTRFCSSPKLT